LPIGGARTPRHNDAAARKHAEIERLVHQAMPSWRNVRSTLNRIAAPLGDEDGVD
jgi:hypothetical protein